MTESELNELIESIMKRGSPAYNTPSGAFLEILSIHASNQDIESFALSCKIYTSTYPYTKAFVAGRVPGILCSRFLAVINDFDFNKFIHWTSRTENWKQELIESFNEPSKLNQAIKNIISNSQKPVVE